MAAADDLLQLIREGFLEKEVVITYKGKEWKFKMRSITIQDEAKAMRNALLTGPPINAAEEISYLVSMLPYAIYNVNGDPISLELAQQLVILMDAPMLSLLYDAYKEINTRSNKAGDEIKNS